MPIDSNELESLLNPKTEITELSSVILDNAQQIIEEYKNGKDLKKYAREVQHYYNAFQSATEPHWQQSFLSEIEQSKKGLLKVLKKLEKVN